VAVGLHNNKETLEEGLVETELRPGTRSIFCKPFGSPRIATVTISSIDGPGIPAATPLVRGSTS
jgi:hypothetical protein